MKKTWLETEISLNKKSVHSDCSIKISSYKK